MGKSCMIDFIQKFVFDGFEPGDYIYGTIHISSMIILFISIVLCSFLFRNKDSEYIHNKLKILAYITLSIYMIRRGIKVYEGESFLKAFWPFYLCNVNTVFLSIYLIFDIKRGKDFFIITGLAGAVLMFVVPDGVFIDRYITLGMLDSLLSHYEIIFIPVVLLITKAYSLDVRHSWEVVIGLLIVTFNVEFLQKLLINEEIDFLFLDGTLPFTINGVNQFFILFPLAIIFVYFVYFIDYIYISKITFKKIK